MGLFFYLRQKYTHEIVAQKRVSEKRIYGIHLGNESEKGRITQEKFQCTFIFTGTSGRGVPAESLKGEQTLPEHDHPDA